MQIDREEINKRLEDKGFYYKSFKVWNVKDLNDILQECLLIKQLYKDDWNVNILQVESCNRIVSINLEISKEV